MAKKTKAKSEQNEGEVRIGIDDIKILKLSINPSIELRKIQSPTKFTFHYHVNSKVEPTTLKKVGITLSMLIRENHSDEKSVVGEFAAGMTFYIENDNVILLDKAGQSIIPEGLLQIFMSLTISTVRGLMAAEFRGTLLEKAYLPILDGRTLAQNLAKASQKPVL